MKKIAKKWSAFIGWDLRPRSYKILSCVYYYIWIQELFEGFFIWYKYLLSQCLSSYSYVSIWGILFSCFQKWQHRQASVIVQITSFCSAAPSGHHQHSPLMDLQFSNLTAKWQQRPNVSLLIACDCCVIWNVWRRSLGTRLSQKILLSLFL